MLNEEGCESPSSEWLIWTRYAKFNTHVFVFILFDCLFVVVVVLKETERKSIELDGLEGAGRSWGRGKCDQNTLYEKIFLVLKK